MSSDTNTEAADYGTVSDIVSSKYRKAVVSTLLNGPATPSGVAKKTGHRITHCSRALKELQEMGVVELIVPEDRHKGRVYALTDDGRTTSKAAVEVES